MLCGKHTRDNRNFRCSYQILPNILGELGTTCFFIAFSSLDLHRSLFCSSRGFWQSCWPQMQGGTEGHEQHWQTHRDKGKQFEELGSFRCSQGGHWKALLGSSERTLHLFGIWLVFTVWWDWLVWDIMFSSDCTPTPLACGTPPELCTYPRVWGGNGPVWGDNPQSCFLVDPWLIAACLEGGVCAVALRQWTVCSLVAARSVC